MMMDEFDNHGGAYGQASDIYAEKKGHGTSFRIHVSKGHAEGAGGQDDDNSEEPDEKTKPKTKSRNEQALVRAFEHRAAKMATLSGKGAREVSETYKDAPGRLKAIYNSVSGAKGGMKVNIFWGAVAFLVVKPLVIIPATFFALNCISLMNARRTLNKDIADHRERMKSLPPVKPEDEPSASKSDSAETKRGKPKGPDSDIRMT